MASKSFFNGGMALQGGVRDMKSARPSPVRGLYGLAVWGLLTHVNATESALREGDACQSIRGMYDFIGEELSYTKNGKKGQSGILKPMLTVLAFNHFYYGKNIKGVRLEVDTEKKMIYGEVLGENLRPEVPSHFSQSYECIDGEAVLYRYIDQRNSDSFGTSIKGSSKEMLSRDGDGSLIVKGRSELTTRLFILSWKTLIESSFRFRESKGLDSELSPRSLLDAGDENDQSGNSD